MSAADNANAKPPRPCTEYNIYFQLERAYILQVILKAEPHVDGEAFRPSQPTYAGLPPLPERYASLVLPYDWHLPGKERRRKRKHRKSHGVIGFHDLSTRIANAWKDVDEDIKAYCSQVCAAGMQRYKTAMKEWKLNGGQQEEMMKRDFEKQRKLQETNKRSLKALLRDTQAAMASPNILPKPVFSQVVTLEEMNRAFQKDMVSMGDEEILGMWNNSTTQDNNEPLPAFAVNPNSIMSTNAGLGMQQAQDYLRKELLRNVSIVSQNETVDMDDREIYKMWNNGADNQFCYDCTPTSASSATSAASANSNNNTVDNNSVAGGNNNNKDAIHCYPVSDNQDIHQMKRMLEQQMANLETMKRRASQHAVVGSPGAVTVS